MSSEHKTSPSKDENWLDAGQPVAFWLDTWWPLLVIIFGISLFSIFIAWKPFTV